MKVSQKSYLERLYDILRKDLIAVQPEYADRDVILCPLCHCELRLQDIGSVEHIIPETILKDDVPAIKRITIARRAGLTILCRGKRPLFGGGGEAPLGCNGFKGSKYDRLFRGMLRGRSISESEITPRHRIAILTMAYLGAFQRFGYRYILDVSAAHLHDSVRFQFDMPDRPLSMWLQTVGLRLEVHEPETVIYATGSGLPFVFAGGGALSGNLMVMFRRFRACLPGGEWLERGGLDPLMPATIPADIVLPNGKIVVPATEPTSGAKKKKRAAAAGIVLST